MYNIGSNDVEGNIEIARRLLRLMGQSESLLTYVKDRPGHDRRYALRHVLEIQEQLGWAPAIPLDEELAAHDPRWYRNNTAWLEGVRGQEYRSYYDKFYLRREESLRAVSPSRS